MSVSHGQADEEAEKPLGERGLTKQPQCQPSVSASAKTTASH